MKDWHKKPPARVRNSIMALADAERLRGDLPNVVQVYARDWDKVILADEIYRLRDWIREEGHRSNTCTYNVLGEICEGCKCGKDKRANVKVTGLPQPADGSDTTNAGCGRSG